MGMRTDVRSRKRIRRRIKDAGLKSAERKKEKKKREPDDSRT